MASVLNQIKIGPTTYTVPLGSQYIPLSTLGRMDIRRDTEVCLCEHRPSGIRVDTHGYRVHGISTIGGTLKWVLTLQRYSSDAQAMEWVRCVAQSVSSLQLDEDDHGQPKLFVTVGVSRYERD